jgi:hypothetical protein
MGWMEVSTGLNRILLGHLILIGTVGLIIGLLVYLAEEVMKMHGSSKTIQTAEAIFLIGGAVTLVIVVFSYGLILYGQWKCLMYSPERRGAKWLMFCVITCAFLSPALSAGIVILGGIPAAKANNRMAASIAKKMSDYRDELAEGATLGSYLQYAGSLLAMAGSVCFVLFMRAVAKCFNDQVRLRAVDLYILFWILLTVASGGLIAAGPEFLFDPQYLLGLGAGWVLSGIWWLALIWTTSSCIQQGLSRRIAPLSINAPVRTHLGY